MKKRIISILVLLLVLTGYFFLYIATSKVVPCEGDCEKVEAVSEAIRTGRQSYVAGAHRCTGRVGSDTLCIFVRDTTGINWGLLADTTCSIATQYGLVQQKIFIIKNNGFQHDTVAIKICP